jgi:hypothetical protein
MATSEKTLKQRWMDLFAEEGYRPHLEEDETDPERSSIAFKAEGVQFTLYLHDRDPGFYNLSLTYRLGNYTTTPDFALLAAANEENWEAKVTKAIISLQNRSASFNIEAFSEELPSVAVLERMIKQLDESADRFFGRLKESAKPVVLAS